MWCISLGGGISNTLYCQIALPVKSRVANRLATLHYLTCDFLHGRQKTYCYPKQGHPFLGTGLILNTFDWFFPQNENFPIINEACNGW